MYRGQRQERSRGWASRLGRGEEREVGDDLRSQGVAAQVPSALAGLTAGFEKGPGVPPPLKTPTNLYGFCKPPTPCCNHKVGKGILRLCNSQMENQEHGVEQCSAWLANTRLESDKAYAAGEAMEEKPSTISTGRLKTLLPLHLPPIKQVVYLRSYLVLQ
jgi:hypothetical protein